MSEIVIPEEAALYDVFASLVTDAKIIILTGLPGVGKSLYVQQLALMAQAAGRRVHLLQWDVTRAAFETDAILEHYPEVDGVTHAMIRQAVGLWARGAILQWATAHDTADVLIGEATFVGERLMQLAVEQEDAAEALLASEATQFVLPVPTREVRAMIEDKRAASIANPQHAHERKDAPPNVLQMLWHEIHSVGTRFGFGEAQDTPAYDPAVYRQTYEHLLRDRHCVTLSIDAVYTPQGSVYDLEGIAGHLQATPDEVEQIMTQLARDSSIEAVEAQVARWYEG